MTRHQQPEFVIIGAQKSASTFLAESLRRHPEVFLHRGEDPYFRDPVYELRSDQAFRASFDLAPPGARIGLKCPDYLARAECAPRIHADLGAPELLVTLRDPVARAVSAYFWYVKWGVLPLEPVDVGLAHILDGHYASRFERSIEILEWGLYAKCLHRYLDYFPRSKLLILFDVEIRNDPALALRKVHEFIGVNSDISLSTSGKHNEGIYSLPRLRFLRMRNRLVWATPLGDGHVAPLRPHRFAPFLLNAGVVLVDRLLLARIYGNAVPRLSAVLQSRLEDYYASDTNDLVQLLGGTVPPWHTGAKKQ